MSTTKTISTDEEVIYTPEDTLPAVPAAQVKQLRALNTNGESVNVSPATLRELTGNNQEIYFDRNDLINTEQLIELLTDRGAFKNGYWCTKVGFSYSANPRVQTHSVGVISLAGAVIECFGTNKCYCIRITTANTAADATDLVSCVATYTNNSEYTPGWKVQSIGGIDYSLLTEQAVPGEFWPDVNGARRQVYTQTLLGTLPTTISSVFALDVYLGIQDVAVLPNSQIANVKQCRIETGADLTAATKYYWTYDVNQGWFRVLVATGSSLLGGKYILTLKYTKR